MWPMRLGVQCMHHAFSTSTYNSLWLRLQSLLVNNQWRSLGIVAFNMCLTYRGSMETSDWSSKAQLSCWWLMQYTLCFKTHTTLSLKITLNALQHCWITILLDPSKFYLNLLILYFLHYSNSPWTHTIIWLFSAKGKDSIHIHSLVKWLCSSHRYLFQLQLQWAATQTWHPAGHTNLNVFFWWDEMTWACWIWILSTAFHKFVLHMVKNATLAGQ